MDGFGFQEAPDFKIKLCQVVAKVAAKVVAKQVVAKVVAKTQGTK